MTQAPTYTLQPDDAPPDMYLKSVARLADEVLAVADETMRPIVDTYGAFIDRTRREPRRSYTEYVVEVLLLGVLWRVRGPEAVTASTSDRNRLVVEIVRERRAGHPRRRDDSTAPLVYCDTLALSPSCCRSLDELARLQDWMLATGEYDDELKRLEGWGQFLHSDPSLAGQRLWAIGIFATEFERLSERALGSCTSGVDAFITQVLPERGPREDMVQCSRRRLEYHFNMVGAELLNRAWRPAFLARRRHVVVVPGCARRNPDIRCHAQRQDIELRCIHCTPGCAVSDATLIANSRGAEALAVLHGSDFSRFLNSPALRGGDVGIVGVACAPGLVGAGWRAWEQGLPAQCVLLQASGCAHWRTTAVPTRFDRNELARILTRDEVGLHSTNHTRHGGMLGVNPE